MGIYSCGFCVFRERNASSNSCEGHDTDFLRKGVIVWDIRMMSGWIKDLL